MALCIFFFLWMRTGKGRRRLFPYITSLPLSPRNLKKPDTTHSLFIKKKMLQMVSFWMALCIFFFLWMRTGKGRRRLFPYIASLPLSPRNLKKPDTTHTNGLP
jgi:hypothetical protein